MKSKKRVRFEADEHQAEGNEDEGDRRKRQTVGTGQRRAYDEAVEEEQREHEDGMRRESENTGGSRGSDDPRATGSTEADEGEPEEGRVPEAMIVPEGPSHQERERSTT